MANEFYRAALSSERLRSTSISGRTRELEMLSDTGRIISSSAFRRLQTKAQVFSLERNAAVRTRLTHSLEVATLGQFIAERAFELLSGTKKVDPALRLPFVQTVQNACLLHDIGNPPFGHLGEFAVRDWFARKEAEITSNWKSGGMSSSDISAHMPAFVEFDGNPQGFRIVTKLMWLNDEWGLNLSCALLASTVKYLGEKSEQGPFRKKVGYFATERARIAEVWKVLCLKVDANGLPAQRHPLVFLMEAADDIAYCLSDIEDAIEKRVCTQDEFFEHVAPILGLLPPEAHAAAQSVLGPRRTEPPAFESANARFIQFSRHVTRQLTETAAMAFLSNEAEIRNGFYTQPLLDGSDTAAPVLQSLKDFAKTRIFVAREAVEIELGGFRIVQALLDGFNRLLQLSPQDFRRLERDSSSPLKYGELALESRLHGLLPNKHWIAYAFERDRSPHIEPALRAHMIVDYVTGMTDGFALKIFHMLMGTSHPTLDG